MLPEATARSSFDGHAICYVLLVCGRRHVFTKCRKRARMKGDTLLQIRGRLRLRAINWTYGCWYRCWLTQRAELCTGGQCSCQTSHTSATWCQRRLQAKVKQACCEVNWRSWQHCSVRHHAQWSWRRHYWVDDKAPAPAIDWAITGKLPT